MSHQSIQSRGFTLVELLVTLGIFMVMTGVVLANYRTYNTGALFANASEDIVLALRQAQVYGVGVKKSTSSCGASEFECSYGVYFLQGAKNIIIFTDRDSDKVYTSADNPPIETISWGNSISISSLLCTTTGCPMQASVTFKRPNPDAFIASTASQGVSHDTVSVTLTDTNTGKSTTVNITKAGQISLQ